MGRMKPAALLRQSKRQKAPARLSMTTVVTCSVVIIMFLISLAVLHKHKGTQQRQAVADGWVDSVVGEAEPGKVKDSAVTAQHAILNTTKGLITVQLYGRHAPEAVEGFVTRSQDGFYDGALFYRVLKGEMIQAGGQRTNTSGGFPVEVLLRADESFPLTLVAKPGLDTKGSQLFITAAAAVTPDLKNGKHPAVGSVIHGQEVVQEIENSTTDSEAQPLTPIVIYNIIIKDSVKESVS